MINIGRYSIRKKLTWMNLLVSGATLLIASSAFVAYELATLRLAMVRNLSVEARIAGANCASAIVFGDPDSARDTLSALNEAPNIMSVAIYPPSGSGEPFAAWVRPSGKNPSGKDPGPAPSLQPGQPETYSFAGDSLVLVRPIVFQGDLIGTIRIRSDMKEISDMLLRYAGIVAIILLVSLPAAILFSAIFQRATARPIVQLAGVARMVSREKKYTVRAPVSGSHDEIALLIEAFNEMLDQIQERDAALHRAHEQLNLALKSSGVGTWSWGVADDTFVWDDFMYPLFGLGAGVALHRYEDFLKLVHPKDRDRVRKAGADSAALNVPYDVEFRVIWPDGSIHSLSARGKVFRDQEDRLVRLTGVCWDISERKRAEEDRQKFVSLVEQTDDFVGMFDLDGRIMFLNRAGCRLVGLEAQRAVDTRFEDLHPEDAWSRVSDEILPSILRGDGNWVGEARLRHLATRQPIDVLMNIFPVSDPETSQLLCFAAIMRDITERKRLEEQLLQAQKLDSIGQLAGGVAHDFNNLLTIISGYSELILGRCDPDDPVCEPVEQISRAATRAAALTRQLLAFGSRQPSEQKDIVLNDVVGGVEKMLRRLIGEDVDLVLSLEAEDGTIRADSGQIEQVIVNLVINARDAMPGGGKLLIETANLYIDEESAQGRLAVTPGHYVMLAVSDTGVGMTGEVKSRIFEPFFTTKARGKGTGLGLSTVYGIVQQSRASISVQSEPGHGTTFRLLFPAVHPGEQELVGTGADIPSFGHETILLTEDEAGVRGYVRHILERHGYHVAEASNGLEAMDVVRRYPGPIHLLLTDVVMPEVGGVELASQFAAVYPEVPVLYMSGYNDRLWMESDTPVDYIQKPFASTALLAQIRELLDARRESLERQTNA
jgi:two-component system, cell cycle sensor histidine kinase and response regulator CckA